ncbi:Protease HtpX [Nitrososphaera viennensis EN76]|uniref:Protease HtpX homolog n=1 Tax=Nitrososphaera viennensis EN76 TaxID=926571 RepID=A0A060HL94_9ARCH|nr:Protease HtpX [Nitrososphaera viennensis EN76]
MILSFAVLAVLYLVFLGVLVYLGVGYIPIAIIGGLMVLAQWYFSDKIVLWSSGAKVVTKDQYPKLHAIVERLAAENGLPMPKIAVMNTQIPNAFATGKSPKSAVVAATAGLMNTLDDDELEGVLAHELAHVKNRDVLVITLASLFSIVAFSLMRFGLFSSMFGGYGYGYYGGGRNNNGAGAIVIIIAVAAITWFVSFLIIRAISRYREFAADRGSAQMTRKPEKLANALLKISGKIKAAPQRELEQAASLNTFFIMPALSRGSLSNLFSTHPPVEERVRRLMEMQSLLK